jgi:hypothetical protein
MVKKIVIAFIVGFICSIGAASRAAQSPEGYRLKLVQPAGANGSTFEDEAIKISFPLTTHLSFTITNKTLVPVQLNWKNASFTDISGQTHRVVCGDVRFSANPDAQPALVVNPNAAVGDSIVPVGFISQEGTEKWLLRPLFHSGLDTFVGKNFSLRLPVTIGTQERNYLFTFTVESLK